MDIASINNSITENKRSNCQINKSDAQNEFKTELLAATAEQYSCEDIKNDISINHNANITTANKISGLNNVIIGRETLLKMKNDKQFYNKIMKIIDDNCSEAAQNELRTLSPPVKSSGVIIYPDGQYLCWVESIYSDRVEKDTVVKTIMDEVAMRGNISDSTVEDINALYANLAIINTGVLRKRL